VPPRKKPPNTPPLTDGDVADLAFRVKGGDTPRVVVRTASASVPAGTRGNVIKIGKPSEGEYIVVRLGRDQVPFAPSELSLPNRGRGAAAPAPAAKKTAAAASRSTKKATSANATKSAPAKKTAAKASPAKAPATKRAPSSAPAKVTKRAPARRGGKRAPQALTVTLRFADSRWTVEAQRGARRLAKASALRPGAVSAFAEHVDEPNVRDALVETVESCRAVVEERAAGLRAELQATENALREYDARRR